MYHTEASIVIGRSSVQVFAMVSDLDRHAEWQHGLIESRWTSERTGCRGATYTFVTRFAGSSMDLPGEITAWDPGSGWSWRATGGPFPVQGGFHVADVEGGTLVTMFSDSQPRGWMAAMRPLLRWIGERGYRRSLVRLKALVETAPGR